MATDPPILLYVALEAWFSSTRLPRRLAESGFTVVAVCTPASPLRHTGGIAEHVLIGPEGVTLALERACARHDPALIVAVDEAAVTMLRQLAHDPGVGLALAALIVRSIGAPARDGAASKERINAIAADLGIRVPRQAVCDTAAAACVFARATRYPIVLKKEATFGGQGVMRCWDDRATLGAWYRLQARARWQRGVARFGTLPAYGVAPLRHALLRRRAAPLIAQQFVDGRIGFRTFVADRGRVLAGITAIAQEHNPPPFGASSVVRFIDHPEIEQATAALVRGLDLSGFGGIDFILESGSDAPYLLELNARVTPIAHLGRRLGVDLCAALHGALTGAPATAAAPMREAVVALFPSELERDPHSRWFASAYHDVPWDEPALLAAWRDNLPEPVRAFLAQTEPAA